MNLHGKTRVELEMLRSNAERVLGDPSKAKQHQAARDLLANLAALPQPAKPGVRRRPGRLEAVELLTRLAREVTETFDLQPPPDTARPHKLTAENGEPKVGGRQRRNVVAVDRYLSHRRGDAVASLGWLRRHDEEPDAGGGWYIDYVDVDTLPSLLADQTFETARSVFIARLEAIGTPRRRP